MDLLVIEVEKREALGSRASQKLRAGGRVPIVLCGLGRESISFSAPRDQVDGIVKAGAHLVEIDLGGTQQQALLKDIQWDYLGDEVLHMDFARVDRDKKVTLTVPIEFEGHAKGTAEGGVLNHVMNDIEIECLPKHIPNNILVNVSEMGVGEHLFAKDLAFPDGVGAVHPDAVVATVTFAAAAEDSGEDDDAEPEILTAKE